MGVEMKLSFFCLCLLLLICMTAPGFAATYSVSLPCTGYYSPGASQVVNVNFHQTFASISSVRIAWSGDIFSSMLDVGGGWMPLPGQFRSTLPSATAQTGYMDNQSFNLTTTFQGGGSWAFLLDGQSTLTMYFDENQGDYPGHGDLATASLLLDGTLVPEPSALMCLGMGLAGCVPFLRRKRR